MKKQKIRTKTKTKTELYCGIDIGGTKMAAAIANKKGELQWIQKEPVHLESGPEGLIEQIVRVTRSLREQFNFRQVGIASAGPLLPQTGELLDPTNFFTGGESWGKVPLLRSLKRRCPDLRWSLENDAAAAVLAEKKFGKSKDKQNIVVLTLGTGVGVGVVMKGQLLQLRGGLHPEASHFPINALASDVQCGCGQSGCVEAYLGVSHFLRRASLKLGFKVNGGKELLDLYRAQNQVAIDLMDEYLKVLVIAIRSYCLLFGPEVVILSGGFGQMMKPCLPFLRSQTKQALSRYREGVDLLPQIRVSEFKDNLVVLGACSL